MKQDNTCACHANILQDCKNSNDKPKPDKYNIFIYHHLTAICRFEKGAYPQNLHRLHVWVLF